MKLNQVIAIESGSKSRSEKDLTETHHFLQKPALLNGIARKYTPNDELGEQLPSESTKVQVKVEDTLTKTAQVLVSLFDVTASKDWGNCVASADVVVEGKVLVEKAPVSYLLFLEKQLVNLYTFVKKLPTLDPSETWAFDPGQDCYATEPSVSIRTKKIPRSFEKSPATDKHPAQTELFYEDVSVGKWSTVKYSGSLPSTRYNQLVDRIVKLQEAVKLAREEANSAEVNMIKVGDRVFGYLFSK